MSTKDDIQYFKEEWNGTSNEEQSEIAKLNFVVEGLSPDKDIKCDFSNAESDISKKFEDDSDAPLYCENCNLEYEDYCPHCAMLVRILDSDIEFAISDRARKTLPKDVLEIKSSPIEDEGIFTLKLIPKDVIFGPFDALDIKEHNSGCMFRVKDPKLLTFEKEKYSNWMGYVNIAQNSFEHNLIPFQYDRNLFFRTTRHITKGEELLVCYGTEFATDSKTFYKPIIEQNNVNVYACISCCLGYGEEKFLLHHQKICPHNTNRNKIVSEQIVLCPTCVMFINVREFSIGHKSSCEEKCKRRLELFREHPKAPTATKKSKSSKCDSYADWLKHYNIKPDASSIAISSDSDTSGQQPYKCKECNKQFQNSHGFKRHKLIHEEKKFECEACGNKFRKKSSLICHQMLHTGETRFQCADCDYKSIYKNNLERHVKKEHLNAEKEYKCQECDYRSYFVRDLRNHERTHKGNKDFKCKICEKGFLTTDRLRAHEVVHTNVRPFLCSQCEKTFKTNEALKTHVFHCHSEKNFECDFCNFKAIFKEVYDRHLTKYHPDGGVEKKHKCLLCKYQTNDRGNFNKHVNNHNGYRPFVCNVCNKGCVGKRSLNIHMLTHDGKKEFECANCNKKFLSKLSLKSHMSVHRTEKRYKCSRCDYECDKQFSLHLHIRSKHKSEENKT